MNHGSLFSGIGGFDLGFERAGIETIWQVEIDDYCRRVLRRHFPLAQRFSDIRECGRHNLGPVDIVSGGFPCQDISNAGKRAGIDGERSGLWGEYARIIRELRPRYVVVENVAALLGRGMERVLGDLAACGYDAEWQSIRASDVGAPHRRERIWIVAYPNGIGSRKVGSFDAISTTRKNPDDVGSVCEVMADTEGFSGKLWTAKEQRQGRFASRCFTADAYSESLEWPAIARSECNQWTVEPDVGRVAHGVSARVDRLRGLGNAIVPQIAEWIGRRIVLAEAKP